MEVVNIPANMVGILKPRSTLQRMGLFLRTTQIAPGYSGDLTFALKNEGPAAVKIDIGARIVHLMVAEVRGTTALYRGQWQGGRVTTTKKEKQV
jgi:deoxycytidine triphosphate deaminase